MAEVVVTPDFEEPPRPYYVEARVELGGVVARDRIWVADDFDTQTIRSTPPEAFRVFLAEDPGEALDDLCVTVDIVSADGREIKSERNCANPCHVRRATDASWPAQMPDFSGPVEAGAPELCSPPDGTSDTGGEPPPSKANDGCACSTSPPGSPREPRGWLALLVLLPLGLRRALRPRPAR